MLTITELHSAVVKVTGTRPGAFGTGFAIERDAHYLYIVTCYHVIREVGGEKALLVRQAPAELVAFDPEDGFDLALLRVEIESLPDVPILPYAQVFPVQQRFHLAGFYRYDKLIPAKRVAGNFVREDALFSDYRKCHSRGWRIQIDAGEALESGLSGGPMVNEAGQVLAVISCKEGEGKAGFAVSIEALTHIWQLTATETVTIPLEVRTASRQLRQRDGSFLMNFETELPEFEQLVREPNPTVKLIVVQGPSGSGKTELLKEYRHLIREHRRQEPVSFDLAEHIKVEQYLDDIIDRLGSHWFDNYRAFQRKGKPEPLTYAKEEEWENNLTREFFDDLTRSGINIAHFIFFDQYEKADRSLKHWFTQSFLPKLYQKPLVVIIAGQDAPDRLPSWETKRHFRLKGVSIDWYQRYAEARGVILEQRDLDTSYQVSQGLPKLLVGYIDLVATQQVSIGARL